MPSERGQLQEVSAQVPSSKKASVAAALPEIVVLVAALAPAMAKASPEKRRKLLLHNKTFAAIVEPLISVGLIAQ